MGARVIPDKAGEVPINCSSPGCDYTVIFYSGTPLQDRIDDLSRRGCTIAVDTRAQKIFEMYCPEHKSGPWAEEVKKSNEVRTTSSTGGEKGVKPERMSLIPVEALEIMGRLYGFGEQKYAAHNWRKGYEWSKSYDSLQRHASAFWRGEDYDEETGLPHLAGVVFHAFTLMIFMQEQPDFDDRFKPDQSKMIQENLAEMVKAMTDYRT